MASVSRVILLVGIEDTIVFLLASVITVVFNSGLFSVLEVILLRYRVNLLFLGAENFSLNSSGFTAGFSIVIFLLLHKLSNRNPFLISLIIFPSKRSLSDSLSSSESFFLLKASFTNFNFSYNYFFFSELKKY